MKSLFPTAIALFVVCFASGPTAGQQTLPNEATKVAYPDAAKRTLSPGHTSYFVDPGRGDDANAGTKAGQPWKSLAKINSLKFAPGDKIVIAPGAHQETLMPLAEGSADEPVVIEFLPGLHTFTSVGAYARPWFVSNGSGHWDRPRPSAILSMVQSTCISLAGALRARHKACFEWMVRRVWSKPL